MSQFGELSHNNRANACLQFSGWRLPPHNCFHLGEGNRRPDGILTMTIRLPMLMEWDVHIII